MLERLDGVPIGRVGINVGGRVQLPRRLALVGMRMGVDRMSMGMGMSMRMRLRDMRNRMHRSISLDIGVGESLSVGMGMGDIHIP